MQSLLSNAGLSLFSIPAVWFVSFFPASLKTVVIGYTIGFDNVDPRSNVQRIADSKTSPEVIATVKRMEAAHQNGIETLPLWIAAVLAGNFAGLDKRTLNVAAVAFVSLRVLYTYTYITQKTLTRSILRSTLYFAGISIPLQLLVKAANKVRLT
ncbi:hypothetical protein BV22DRAFT_1030507 [Leucogyrophana mollusca]|uniref:Uncharacterized protein n=1 Tax=Leucogyrophana mollusca TaxID=85980 RepID=A0ACB8BVC0_9AGAM|nr:hypothetical protein BV22DRAFT_1030507 [Leucogyrophana mollusca]